MDMKRTIADLLKETIDRAYPGAENIPTDLLPILEVPPDKQMGDYAFPCFKLSKALRKAPPAIAKELQDAFRHDDVARAECAGPYLNFFLNRGNFAEGILSAVLENPERWGSAQLGRGKTICLDYSSINIAKRFHIGHLSTTVLGNSLKRIFEFLGYQTVGINHLGDWGTQFGKMIAAYKHWGSREMVEAGGVNALSELYVRFHAEAEKDPALEDEAEPGSRKSRRTTPKRPKFSHGSKN